MITCVNSTKLSIKDQARILANWLKRGISFPYEKQSADASAAVLYREPPARTELAFQQKDGDAAMKTKLTPLLGEERKKELFCIGHGEFSLKSGTDQEHADPFTAMRQKQSRLLKYLRDNPEFTAAFNS
jgi:hypothetical protein